jgi:hypothetical protein
VSFTAKPKVSQLEAIGEWQERQVSPAGCFGSARGDVRTFSTCPEIICSGILLELVQICQREVRRNTCVDEQVQVVYALHPNLELNHTSADSRSLRFKGCNNDLNSLQVKLTSNQRAIELYTSNLTTKYHTQRSIIPRLPTTGSASTF